MPFDKTAHAAQIASCFDHTGDALFFEDKSFAGNIGSTAPRGVPPLTDIAPRGALYLTAARTAKAFASVFPKIGSYIYAADGLRYRVLQDHSQPRLAIFVVTPGT